jgi:alanyl-tRNA synthetase
MGKSLSTAKAIRNEFTDFFSTRGHEIVSSGSLIPHDQTLLFTVAGMVQFKPYLIGEQPAPWPRAVTVQKCVRAGGKHNDLDEVGRTSRHLTFFEMMGNFSFGDYFKSDACSYAWEFVTKNLGLDPERLWVTVHESDDEAEGIWINEVGVDPGKIQRLGEDNYWRMAETGPCGPCSEIFWDKGPEFGADGGPAQGGEERFVEIWNLVFMQFEQHPDGSTSPLPSTAIDTGAGLERILTVMQGVDSVWETDEISEIIEKIGKLAGVSYGEEERADISMRIIADHTRSSTFLISDGVFPSNEDRGYVLRRIIRRSVRHAWLLGLEDSVMPSLAESVVAIMGSDYPELKQNIDFIQEVLSREEDRFRETLKSGLLILDEAIADLGKNKTLSGEVSFKLHDTYGFPLELTEEICAERSIEVDIEGFKESMARQQERARSARKDAMSSDETGELRRVLDEKGPTSFVGYDKTISDSTVIYFDDNLIALDETPFYAESGGQIGDTGRISTKTGEIKIVDTTLVLDAIHVHQYELVDGYLELGQQATAEIDSDRRSQIRRNHTATHLLHWALREVLGEHVKQQGSYVGSDRLRFDFSHFEAVTDEQVSSVEDLVNSEILNNSECHHNEMTREEAEEKGAIAFFGDKYGETVRVLEAGSKSLEFCGGTHVSALGDIGLVKIVSEGSIGSNIRRLEAVTGTSTVENLREAESFLSSAAHLVGVPREDLLDGIQRKMDELKALKNEVQNLKRKEALGMVKELAENAENGIVVSIVESIDRESLRELAVAVRDQEEVKAVILGTAPIDGGAALIAAVKTDSGLNAGTILSEAAKTIGGGGRPNAELTIVGGKSPENLEEALEQARAVAQTG